MLMFHFVRIIVLLQVITACSYPHVHLYTDTGLDLSEETLASDMVEINGCGDTQSDPNNCGVCGNQCIAPQGTIAVCTSGVCDWVCGSGLERVGSGCDVRVPRPVAPLSFGFVSQQTPTVRWELPQGVTTVTLEVCHDRTFTQQCQTVDTPTNQYTLPNSLSSGFWYWRLRGKVGSTIGMRTSPTWSFFVGHRSATISTSNGSITDMDGDGLADLIVAAPYAAQLFVYRGTSVGLSSAPAQTLASPDASDGVSNFFLAAADFNGDGRQDIAVTTFSAITATGRVYIFDGTNSGINVTPSITLSCPNSGCTSILAPGDVNGDGYADLAVTLGTQIPTVGVFLGSPSGLSLNPATTITNPESSTNFGFRLCGADFNGDGLGDLIVTAPNSTNRSGRVFHYRGSQQGVNSQPFQQWTGASADDNFGSDCSSTTDVNGDGLPDLVITSRSVVATNSTIQVFHASSDTIANTANETFRSPNANFNLRTGAGVGDVNGDGFGDVLLVLDAVPNTNPSSIQLQLGSATGAFTASTQITPSATERGWANPFGTPGDVNGDGRFDVFVAEPFAANFQGQFWFYLGTINGLVVPAQLNLMGPRPNSAFGYSMIRF